MKKKIFELLPPFLPLLHYRVRTLQHSLSLSVAARVLHTAVASCRLCAAAACCAAVRPHDAHNSRQTRCYPNSLAFWLHLPALQAAVRLFGCCTASRSEPAGAGRSQPVEASRSDPAGRIPAGRIQFADLVTHTVGRSDRCLPCGSVDPPPSPNHRVEIPVRLFFSCCCVEDTHTHTHTHTHTPG